MRQTCRSIEESRHARRERLSTDADGVPLLRAMRTVIIVCAINVSAAPGRPAVASPAQPTGQIALLGSGGGVNTYALAEMGDVNRRLIMHHP